jgi:RHS repeat-associated protein
MPLVSTSGTLAPEYHIRDHLGNVRVAVAPTGSLKNELVVKQVNAYYPFGKTAYHLENASGNQLKYNGKELQHYALSGISLGWYDYGARFYDPSIARWHVIDPLAEATYGWTPYRYAFNNPLRFIDPDGLSEEEGHEIGYGAKTNTGAVTTYGPTQQPPQQKTEAVKAVNSWLDRNFGNDNNGVRLTESGEKAVNSIVNFIESKGGVQIFGTGADDGTWNSNLKETSNPDSPIDISEMIPIDPSGTGSWSSNDPTSSSSSTTNTSAGKDETVQPPVLVRSDTTISISGHKKVERVYSGAPDTTIILQKDMGGTGKYIRLPPW